MAHPGKKLSEDELPSITVCIPARNEDHALTDCLQAVVNSNYPKLEVIVLDDRSGDNTSALIKSFASEGIRFVEGAELPQGWHGKNHALHELIEEASGKYILFMDVDTRIRPDSIERLARYAVSEKALMVSVLPRREDGWRASVIFPTLRYFWEVMFHQKTSPATASNAWLIDRKTLLEKWNGIELFKDAIQPESRISAQLMATNQYRFVMGTDALGIAYEKKWRSQCATSIRLLFPLLGARVLHSIVAFIDLAIILAPVFVVLAGFVFGWGIHQIIAGSFVVLFAALYAHYLRSVTKSGWWLSALLWPFIVGQEMVLIIMSMTAYLRGKVTWKGRQVQPR